MKLLFCCFALFMCLSSKAQEEADEERILNSLMDSLYQIDLCHKIIKPPYYKCCPTDTFLSTKIIECCKESNIPFKFRVYCFDCVNERDLDSLELIVVVNDSLSRFELTNRKRLVTKEISKKSIFYNFLMNSNINIEAKRLAVDSLKQNNIKFLTAKSFKNEGRPKKYGKSGKQFFIGYLNFSRIYFDRKKGLGIFNMSYLGSESCGYSRFVLIQKIKNEWKIFKTITYGDY